MQHKHIRFLVDECIDFRLTAWLQKSGFDALSIVKIKPGAKDSEILATAASDNRIVLTLDKDFGDLVVKKNELHAGVILLRLNSKSYIHQIKILENFFKSYHNILGKNFIVVSESKVRIISEGQ